LRGIHVGTAKMTKEKHMLLRVVWRGSWNARDRGDTAADAQDLFIYSYSISISLSLSVSGVRALSFSSASFRPFQAKDSALFNRHKTLSHKFPFVSMIHFVKQPLDGSQSRITCKQGSVTISESRFCSAWIVAKGTSAPPEGFLDRQSWKTETQLNENKRKLLLARGW
jgi:hypothetical protein